jgi:dienelactone hydrolase
MNRMSAWPAVLAMILLTSSPALAGGGAGPAALDEVAPALNLSSSAKDLALTKGLAVGLIGSYGRSAVPSDLLAWQLAMDALPEPKTGLVAGKNARGEEQAWAAVEANKDGVIESRALAGGYLFMVVNSETARTMILEATGFYVAWINWEPRGGEKYGAEYLRHPVRLAKGRNVFLVRCERGRFKGRLAAPPAGIFFTDQDMTLPDLIVGEKGPVWAGLRLVNATGERLEGLEVVTRAGGRRTRQAIGATVAPFFTQKLAVDLPVDAPAVEGPVNLDVQARARAGGRTIESPVFPLEIKAVPPTSHHSRTFVSDVDGSVQYFGVAPLVPSAPAATGPAASPLKPALVLTLHGAGVEAIGQARAYKSKDWAWIVAATNRRPYGFDWEDWGRLDALEVLAEATRLYQPDPARIYLTGHSMGGHGAWQVGVTAPDPWAAIAPSAGWRSFTSYGGGVSYKDPSPVEKMLLRANDPSETTELARNSLHYGIYVLHGDQDDNVPVSEARAMRQLLGTFHPDFAYYERPGAGHWWGNECVDWPPLFEFLREHAKPADAEVKRVEFVTANPGISSLSRWVEILAQARPLEYSRVAIERDGAGRAFKGTTENVARLAIDILPKASGGPQGAAAPTPGQTPTPSPDKVVIELDGAKIEIPAPEDGGRVFLENGEKGWAAIVPPSPALKGPQRSGGFKDAFRHRFVFVYGTRGSDIEDSRAFSKARFDAETFWVRGNAGVEIIPDTAFDPARFKDRSVILYGNADTNAAWAQLLAGSPVEIRNGRARIGDKTYAGKDYAAYFVRPRPGSDVASVGAVSWTGPAGWMAASPVQYFISGAGFPDLLLLSAEALRSGTGGVRVLGWFGTDWTVERGDFVWNPGPWR